MGNDRLNTTEVNADLARNLEHWRHEVGKLHSQVDRLKFELNSVTLANGMLIERDAAFMADIDRLRAEAREAALQYLSDTGQMMERIDELTAANIALAADNARMSKRVENAHRIIDRGLWLTDDAPTARAWLAGGAA